ncbi:glutaredoxin [Babesia ovata]|uniref:Glutaredoxin n=1 Tax=Babesia ovata TaxID=189622 RepID=A0A2H6K9Y5_9APIC|nr:glutaredoxin [Babesia ovata]GBE59798.1 glutaredoxin [Babesia ovata]
MDDHQVAAWVEQQARQNKVVVFSRTTCPYCVKANGILMTEAPSDVTVVQLDDHPDRPAIMEYFRNTTGAATVPRVFINGKFFGDCSKTVCGIIALRHDVQVSAQQSGELRKVLLDAGCHLE